ncbi:unnamed protein product [Clonostachys chloroleuca]|uniref:Rik1-associated factor 1 n=1 Tax=Clonostachys chloroleuca TaxID=1926264 RepID=A0AA35QAU3_9HYPO|nr:unnamed protein product [Clonostachys chloroleuca]
MSKTLTFPISTTIIDLTEEDSTPPPTPPLVPASTKRADQARAEPPLKRQRVDTGQLPTRDLKLCLKEQVLPHVSLSIQKLDASQYKVNDIAQQIIITIAKSALFRRRLDETRGYLAYEDEAELAQQASLLVQKLCRELRYQVPPPSSLLNTERLLPAAHAESPPKQATPVTNQPVTATSRPSTHRFQRRERHEFKPLERSNQSTSSAPKPSDNLWFQIKDRPYRTAGERELIQRGISSGQPLDTPLDEPIVYHVDFSPDEIALIIKSVNAILHTPLPPTLKSLEMLLGEECPILNLLKEGLPGRTNEDIRNFCSDIIAGKTSVVPQLLSTAQKQREKPRQQPSSRRLSKMASLLFARELEGDMGFGRTRTYMNFQNEAKILIEDEFDQIAEFTNCAGDITTISWVSDGGLICGTTVHSDPHNQQYNKPGNLLICSVGKGTLRAFADHRIPRPLIKEGQNSTREMRRSQDPWLYCSVVSSDFDPIHRRAYTSSFDKTVKVWSTDAEGNHMECIATWHHEGNVNFVAAAKDGSGRVATAADVPSHAVRVYSVNPDNIDQSPYQSFSCSREDAGDNTKWAYYPATMQWGIADKVRHLLGVGYSPRSVTGDDSEIPEDKMNTGEIMLWDARAGCRLPVMSASTANVFEIAWHPTLQRFIAATSPCGLATEPKTRTQIHLFQRDRDKEEVVYSEYQSLDCPASDINELTIKPNSLLHAYVTAACTDGKVYVWDTAQSDDPIHVLKHDVSLEGFEQEFIETLDTGVKFTAWGTTADRFYTGASDGVVRVWNIRNRNQPYVRTLLEAPGPIASGAFSPDMSKLAIGDASGRLYLFSRDETDAPEAHYTTLPGRNTRVRRPMMFISHPEPPPPVQEHVLPLDELEEDLKEEDDTQLGITTAQHFLNSGQLVLSGDPTIGASQGPNYQDTGLFLTDAHEDQDPNRPLLTSYARQQQESLRWDRGMRRRSRPRLQEPITASETLHTTHRVNLSLDPLGSLAQADIDELRDAGAVLEPDYGFIYQSDDE